MSIKERLDNDIKDAMRSREKNKLGALRLISAAFKQVEIDERIALDEVRMLAILDKLVKQRKESIKQFQSAARDDLVAQEQFELDILTHYLPKPLTDQEIIQLIEQAMVDTNASIMSDMGKVMALLKPLMQGRADMTLVSATLKEKLGS